MADEFLYGLRENLRCKHVNGARIITHGYCLLQAAFHTTLAAARSVGGADLILMSPPYCDARTYDNAVSWTFEDYQRLGDATASALKPGGHCLMVLDAPVRQWRQGIGSERSFMPWKVMLDWG